MGIPQLAASGDRYTTDNFFELQWQTYTRYGFNSGKPISAISWASSFQLFAAGSH
jgi:hypothetical protein